MTEADPIRVGDSVEFTANGVDWRPAKVRAVKWGDKGSTYILYRTDSPLKIDYEMPALNVRRAP